jgi:hypothetical protein
MPTPEFGQAFVKPQSGGVESGIRRFFGGISDRKRELNNFQLQAQLHEIKAGVDTREINNRTTHRVAAEGAGKAYVESHGYKEGLAYKKKHDRWNAKFAKDNVDDLKDNPIYVGVGEVSAKGVKQQKAASVRYPGSPNSQKADTSETKTGTTVNGTDTSSYNASVFNANPTTPNTSAAEKPAKPKRGKKAAAAKPANVKKTSSGGGLTEVRNSDVETGNR